MKKRKQTQVLDYEAIKAKTVSDQAYVQEIRLKISALFEVNFERILSTRVQLNEDEALTLLSAKISVEGVNNLRKAIKHVPENITRVLNGVPLRTTLIHKLFISISSSDKRYENMAIEDISLFKRVMETFCPVFLDREDSEDHLWRLTKSEELSFNKFLTPPLSSCTLCGKGLTVRNNPSRAKFFTVRGPVPTTKVTLECRECSRVYGICNYTDESGRHFYPDPVNVIEVSDVTYVDYELFKLFPALSNHCWVSFSGFSEAYNDICEEAIGKYASVFSSQEESGRKMFLMFDSG